MDQKDLILQQMRADLERERSRNRCLEGQIESWAEHCDRLIDEKNGLQDTLNDCRNELCFVCGRKELEHDGFCEKCRWRRANG